MALTVLNVPYSLETGHRERHPLHLRLEPARPATGVPRP